MVTYIHHHAMRAGLNEEQTDQIINGLQPLTNPQNNASSAVQVSVSNADSEQQEVELTVAVPLRAHH